MRVKLPKYPAYKPSGVEWAGEIPMDWILIRLRYVASVKARLGWKGLTASEYVDVGNIFLSTPDIKSASIDFESANFITDERYLESPEIMLQIGDVLLVKDGATLGIVNLVRHLPGRTTVNGSIAVIRTRLDLTPNFLFYFLKSHYLQNLIQQVKGGMGVPHLFQSDIVKFQLLIPRTQDQKQIVAFLDRETAKIDRLMAVRRKQVECLQEQRAAAIHHAVTKGLDPSAKMKPSGVDWLGDVPAGWQTNKFRFVVRFKGGGTPSKTNAGYWSGDIPWVSPKDMKLLDIADAEDHITPEALADSASSMIEKGSILLVVRSGILRRCIPVAMNSVEVALNQDMKALQTTKIDPRFLMFFILGNQDQLLILWRKQGSTVESLEQPQMGGTFIVIPPDSEQHGIVAHIDRETAKLDTLIAKYQRELELLAEYRASLISHAVTGKIDVRGLVEPTP